MNRTHVRGLAIIAITLAWQPSTHADRPRTTSGQSNRRRSLRRESQDANLIFMVRTGRALTCPTPV